MLIEVKKNEGHQMEVLRTNFKNETQIVRRGQATAIMYLIITSILGFLLLGTKQELLIWLCATFFYISGGLTVTFSNARWGFGFLLVTMILIESLFFFYPFRSFWLWSMPTKLLYLCCVSAAYRAAKRRESIEMNMMEQGWHPLGLE